MKTIVSMVVALSVSLVSVEVFANKTQPIPISVAATDATTLQGSQRSPTTDFNSVVGPFISIRDAPQNWHPTSTRSECMVQVQIDNNGKAVTAKHWFTINYRSMPFWVLVAKRSDIAAYVYRERFRSLYLLYAKNCRNRFAETQSFFHWMKMSIVGFPDFKVLHKNIKPSVKTLNICGHWWKDGEKHQCFENLVAPQSALSR